MKEIKILQEFKTFAMRGSVVDLAVGIIIGGAFGKIVTSFVNDILMPPIGFLMGGFDFKNISLKLPPMLGKAPVEIHLGLFINNVVDFTIVAFAIFMMIKLLSKMHMQSAKAAKEEPAPAPPSKEVLLLTEIRDLLKKQ